MNIHEMDELNNGLRARELPRILVGLAACLNREVDREDFQFVIDAIWVLLKFPGSVAGGATVAKVLKGTHPIGKDLAIYGKLKSDPISKARLTEIGVQIYYALCQSGAYNEISEGHGPDHTFRPQTKNPQVFEEMLEYVHGLKDAPQHS